MTEVAETKQDRIARRQVDKFDARRTELAIATLHTLAELGYARTTLREIAQKSEFSHGVLHYYFADKRDLLTEAVRQYEALCVTRYDDVVAQAVTAEQLCREFTDMFVATLRDDAPLHRLWYDLRNQSLFDESFRKDVLEIDERREEMIWRVIARYAELRNREPAISRATAYSVLDGLFQRALLGEFAGAGEPARALKRELPRVLELLVTGRPELG
ncbi:AcrR family transcriptional regulator [Prauserella isguenensis]|uniref:AcrR family transcriptional regulator n=1 Tax=Prauserella isguenensis TaxID=1470180 RepID=A0A839RY41_9PSEU|nr:AcrR family transcriptional regulator [Prauserella isguenensis]